MTLTMLGMGVVVDRVVPEQIPPEFLPAIYGLIICGTLIGIALSFWPQSKKRLVRRRIMAGDSFSNFGNNFGHMGNVFHGPQPYSYNEANKNALLNLVSKEKPISVIGTMGCQQSQKMADEIFQHLKSAGYDVRDLGAAQRWPEIPRGVWVDTKSEITKIEIGPA